MHTLNVSIDTHLEFFEGMEIILAEINLLVTTPTIEDDLIWLYGWGVSQLSILFGLCLHGSSYVLWANIVFVNNHSLVIRMNLEFEMSPICMCCLLIDSKTILIYLCFRSSYHHYI